MKKTVMNVNKEMIKKVLGENALLEGIDDFYFENDSKSIVFTRKGTSVMSMTVETFERFMNDESN